MITVIIPAYNAEKYIAETIKSVLRQTYINWELIIIDDGSSDNTAKIIKDFCKKESKISYYYQNNSGVSSARNNGLKKSNGKFIAFLDADDKWKTTFLELKRNYLSTNENVGAVTSKVTFIDSNSNTIEGCAEGMSSGDIAGMLNFKTKNKTTGPSGILCRKEYVQKIGGFNLNLSNTADKMFFLDLSKETTIVALKEPLWLYRFHEDSMHKNVSDMIKDYESYVKQLELKSYFQSKLIEKNFKKYIYQICSKESIKNMNLKYGIVYLVKYLFA